MVDDQSALHCNGEVIKENNNAEKRSRIVKEKLFVPRNSLLTDLFKQKHCKTAYYISVAISIGICLNALLDSFIHNQSSIIGFRLLKSGLRNFHFAFLVWVFIFLSVLLSFQCYNIWAQKRPTLKESQAQIWDRCWITALVFYYISIFYVASKSIYIFDLPCLSAVVLETETVRFLMKIHSFVRNNAPEVIKHPQVQNGKPIKTAKKFKCFLYFLFAPTLIYKDEYPRTQCIRWNFVASCFAECILISMTLAVVLDLEINAFKTKIMDESLRKYVIFNVLRCNFAGVFAMTFVFYFSLHAFQNLFAELTKFGDREFYQDWWCAVHINQYLKTWNVIVYNWLFIYVYKDIYENVYSNKIVAKLMVVLLSAIIHEIMLGCSLRMPFPFLFTAFFLSVVLTVWIKMEDTDLSHVVATFLFCWGSGLILSAYIVEYNARVHLQVNSDSSRIIDFLVPKSLSIIAWAFNN